MRDKIEGTSQNQFQIGIGGPVLKNESGELKMTDSGGNLIRSIPSEYSANAGINGVGGNLTKNATWGQIDPQTLFRMPKAGEIWAVSATLSTARTAGTCTIAVAVNTVAQNGAGQTTQLNASNTISNHQIISPAISFAAGDLIGVQSVTSSFTPTGADASLAIWYRFTE